MNQHLAVRVEYLRLRYKAQVFTFAIDHRQVPGLRVIKGLHHLFHAVCIKQFSRGRGHQLAHRKAAIKLLSEHDVSDIIEQYNALKYTVAIGYRKHIVMRRGNG